MRFNLSCWATMFYSISIHRNVLKHHFQRKKSVCLPSRGQCWSAKWFSFSSPFGNSWDEEKKKKGRNTLGGGGGEQRGGQRCKWIYSSDHRRRENKQLQLKHFLLRWAGEGLRLQKSQTLWTSARSLCVSVSGTRRAGATAKLLQILLSPRIRQKALRHSSSSLSGDLFVLISPGMRDPQRSVWWKPRVKKKSSVVFLAHDFDKFGLCKIKFLMSSFCSKRIDGNFPRRKDGSDYNISRAAKLQNRGMKRGGKSLSFLNYLYPA